MKVLNRFAIGSILLCLFIVPAIEQESQSPARNGEEPEDATNKNFTIRIAVDEVRIDAVVLDKKGRQLSDLTADDFEIFQDDVPQKILSSAYVSEQKQPFGKVARKNSEGVTPIPTPLLDRDKVRRVIAFIVDDQSMNFENLHHARMALRKFAEKQMQPGDLVAILKTSYGVSALQLFMSDQKQLLARIENIGWGIGGRDLADDYHYSLFDGQLSALRYCIRALKDMPGRKALLMLSAQTTFAGDYQMMYRKAYNRMADEALRAGVVIHLLDIRGLEAPFPGPAFGGSVTFDQLYARASESRNPLPQKTGGLSLSNTNFFTDGIGEVSDALRGYYMLSYTPPETTFKANRKEIYHRIKIKVKRRGAEVHSRDGFFGVSDTAEEEAVAQNPLREAIFSPFLHSDLKVNLASAFIDNPKAGYVIRSWLHLDANKINFIKKNDKAHTLALETVCVTSDVNGYIRDSTLMKYEFQVKNENLQWVKDHGIRFSLILPVKNPGPYYVRVAVKDPESGKVGSAYQFIDIPNLKKGRLALSNLLIINRAEDADWVRSGTMKEVSQNGLSPILRRDEAKSPALREYMAGEQFDYMSVIYNPKHNAGVAPGLNAQYVLYKDGVELLKSEPQPVVIENANNYYRIPIMQKMLITNDMQKGEYILQLLVTDQQRGKKDNLVSQTLNFEVIAK
jgi:VWFA-related protein